jgi:hypothetical protein
MTFISPVALDTFNRFVATSSMLTATQGVKDEDRVVFGLVQCAIGFVSNFSGDQLITAEKLERITL